MSRCRRPKGFLLLADELTVTDTVGTQEQGFIELRRGGINKIQPRLVMRVRKREKPRLSPKVLTWVTVDGGAISETENQRTIGLRWG